MKILLLIICQSLFAVLFAQQINTEENPTHYRRGIETPAGYKSYEQKYAVKNLEEEKRKQFPLNSFNSGTGVWTELNPKVPRVDYLGIGFANKDTGWAVGDLGSLIKTTDRGNNWTVSETNTTTPLLKVRSYNGQIVIASGFDGLILRSTDGGETFEQITSGVTGDLWGLEMLNDTLGWACGNFNSLIKTTDGGQTWQQVTTPGYTANYWWIDFLNKDYGFIAADGKVLKTTDGGTNWEIIQAGDDYPLFSIDVIDSLHIAAAGYGGTSYRGKNIYSSDGGYTWINGGPLTFEAVNDIKYINRDTGYVMMTNVITKKTTNRGQEWTGIVAGGEYEMQFFEFENIGYSAGTELRIYKTENNFESWNRLIINDNFADVSFVSEQKGFALGNILYRTTDGGDNWESNGPGGSSVTFIDSLTGFIGNPGGIWKTTDEGNSWYITSGSNGAGKIFFINATIGWAIRSNIIYKTTDRGENWFTQFTAPSSITFYNIHFIDSLYGWTANLGSRPYKTTNGGGSWIQQTNLDIWESRDIFFRDSLNGFIINGILELQRTTNSGANWFIQLNSQYVIRNLGWLTTSHGFIVGDGVYETVDSGNTWDEIFELRNIGLRKFQVTNNYIGYLSGNLGLIYKYLDTTIVPVELFSFEGQVENYKVILKWLTASELNNRGFEIEKSIDKDNWFNIGFVEGRGTTTQLNHYSFTDNEIPSNVQYYRLKQIDFDGSYEYSNEIEIEVDITPNEFVLYQNYPSPFNPTTKIKFDIPQTETERPLQGGAGLPASGGGGLVTLKVYDILGNEVATLVNENKPAGTYEVEFSAVGLASGVYFYQLKTGNYIATKKLVLLK